MANSALIAAAIAYRARLDRLAYADVRRLVDSYTSLAARLKDKIDLLVAEIEKVGMENITRGQVARMARYTQLMDAVRDELGKYNQYLAIELDRIANTALAQSTIDMQRLVKLAHGYGAFNKLPVGSIKTLLGFLQSGSPLYRRIQELAPLTAERVASGILEGVALGYNPVKVGKMIVDDLGQGLSSAMRWARTTQMWTYREASRATMASNAEILDGWVWFAILDGDVPPCESCIANHGQLFPINEPLDDHYNGRCVALPHVKGDDMPVDPGSDWFDGLDTKTQEKILGSNLEGYNNGDFTFADLTKQVEDPVFGTMRVTAKP
jgi:hypothetical protein